MRSAALQCLTVLSLVCPLMGATLPESEGAAGDLRHASISEAASDGKPAKLHTWNGSLVNAICMAESLREIPSIDQMLYPEPLLGYYAKGIEDSERPAVQGTGSGAAQAGSGTQAASNGEPETSERELDMQAAELRRADLLKQKVNVCLPNQRTAHFGIVVPQGDLLTFDAAGDFQAQKAIQSSMVQAGKALKAKVTGVIIQEKDVIKVASILIKGRIRPSHALFESGALRPSR